MRTARESFLIHVVGMLVSLFVAGTAWAVTCSPCSIWPSSTTPGTPSQNDSNPVTVGVKFTSDVNGYIAGIRFYKGSGNTGTHIGTLWSSSGQQLATATFTNETSAGWQEVDFASPVAITANTVYVASYFAPAGHYAGDDGFFTTSGVDTPPLHALVDGGTGGADGVYTYASANAFPTSTFQSTNYWVDVVFDTTATDTTAPTVTATSPVGNATNVSTTTTVTATFSEAVDPTTINGQTFQLYPGTSPSGTAVSATVTYNNANTTATLTPSAPLTVGATYTATVTTGVKDLAGNAFASNVTWSFSTGAGGCAAPANPIVAENCQPGTASSTWDISGAGDTTIQGFATDISVNRGSTINFKIATPATSYHLDIYRMGYYGGNGARLIASTGPVAGPKNWSGGQATTCLNDSTSGLVDCGNWSVAASWAVPSTATSGIYFARAIRNDTGGASHIFFIVRDDASTSALLFQTSDTTWQAYNDYGGNSLYTGGPGTNPSRAYKVSYNRPFNTRADSTHDWVFNAEYPMVRWLEANGYDVSYTSGLDVDRNGALLRNHKVFMSVGHDEYWSAGQRANVESARNAGVNLAFFSGNEIFWKTRWENSIDGTSTPYRTLVTYKETHANAIIDPKDPPTTTATWLDIRFGPVTSQVDSGTISPSADGGRPGNALAGTEFYVNDGATTAISVPFDYAKMRFWRNTPNVSRLTSGAWTSTSGTLGYEWDSDLDNGFRPAGMVQMSRTVVNNAPVVANYGSTFQTGTATHFLTLYRHASGALVFGAGTVQWSWGLDSHHDLGNAAPDPNFQQATVNLFADMGAQPATLQSGLVAATASTDATAPTSSITSPTNGSTVSPGTTVTITGTANDTGGGVVGNVEVSVDGGATWHPASGRSSWSYAWTTPAAGTVTIKSRAVDDSGNLETPGAGITVTAGSGTTPNVLVGESSLETTADSNTPGIAEAFQYTAIASGTGTTLHLYLDGANAATTVVTGLYSNSASNTPSTLLAQATISAPTNGAWNTVALPSTSIASGARYWIAILGPSGGGQVKFRDTSGTGLSQTTSQSTLTTLPAAWSAGTTYTTGPMSAYVTQDVDTTPPTVTAISPASGAAGVATTTTVTATFSEAMNPLTITGQTFFVTPNGSTTPVTATVSYNTTTFVATLTPSAALAGNTTYNVTVKGGASGVKDVAGNALAADRTWSFTTAAPDTTPPVVTSFSPANGAIGVATNTTVSATFSETMNATTVTSGFVLTGPNNTQISATVSYNATTSVATLTPSSPLAANTTYTATVKGGSTGVEDLAGNAMVADATWQFTTLGDTTAPTVKSTSPSANATGVATTTTVTATFSEALDPNTIDGTTFSLASASGVVAATVGYNSSTFVATLTPNAPLTAGVIYTATILGGGSGVKDFAGNPLASTVSWSFTTSNILLGTATIQSSPDNNKAGTAEAFLYTASASGTATTLNLYVPSGSAATKIVVGIYSHNASTNAPASLLGQGTISTPTSGWNAVSLSTAVTITSNANYWIAVLSPSGSGTVKFVDKSSGGRSQLSSQTTLSALPGTWSSGKSFTTSAMSAYASP